MRVSILVNSVDPTACHDYAVLWLDPTHHVWTRQTSVGIALPPEGMIVEREASTLLTGAEADAAGLLMLGSFRLDAREQLTSIFGTAAWFSQTRHATIDGLWHLRAVERAPDGSHRRRAGSAGGAPPPMRSDSHSGPLEFR
ncbi:MAG TPA: DUF3564 family protein [Paraburkholderia sp.]